VSVDVAAVAGRLLRERGLATEVVAAAPCRAGGNNRVVRLDTDGGRFVAKLYFRSPADRRDRLRSEYSFLEYARRIGLRCVPAPLACDAAEGLAIYEYVPGRPLSPSTLTSAHVRQAIGFFKSLNSGRPPAEHELGLASDAGFSVDDHVQTVERRLARLREVPVRDAVDADAHAFLVDLEDGWATLRRRLEGRSRITAALGRRLEPDQRCLSPSDFGFHNALVLDGGEAVFLDFEYAGWDDPAKAVADFFCQPLVPVDRAWFAEVASGFTSHAQDGPALVERARALFPLFWFNWCLIRLNEFTPTALERRVFADDRIDVAGRKRTQLEDARRALAALPQAGSL
jgi:phosphotransferase family enzyme